MEEFSALAIFWMTFAAFIGPIFLIALVCSITKAIRTRKEIKKRLEQTPMDFSVPEPEAPEVADGGVRRKPNIKLIEDVARKKQFRGNNGSLLYASTSMISPFKKKKFKDTDVDRQTAAVNAADRNRSNFAGGDVSDKEADHSTTAAFPSSDNTNHHNNTHSNRSRHKDNFHHVAASSMKNGRVISNGRRKSLGDSSSPYITSPNCNGHATPDGGHFNHDIDYPGLKPDSHNNRARRHSVNSISPTLERIPEGKCVEVEMNTTRSKSEDTLIDHQSPYLTPGGRGSDNQGFAKRTETTIM